MLKLLKLVVLSLMATNCWPRTIQPPLNAEHVFKAVLESLDKMMSNVEGEAQMEAIKNLRSTVSEVESKKQFTETDFAKILDAASKFCAAMKAMTNSSKKSVYVMEDFLREVFAPIFGAYHQLNHKKVVSQEAVWKEKLKKLYNVADFLYSYIYYTTFDISKIAKVWESMELAIDGAKSMIE